MRRGLLRSWFYFRTGYIVYVSFLIGFTSNIVVLYQLGVVKSGILSSLFPNFLTFTLFGLLISVPACVLLGLWHLKRTGVYGAEQMVQAESSPVLYRIMPGKEKEVLLPLMILIAKGLEGPLDGVDKVRLRETLAKADSLLKGEYVGMPESVARNRM